MHAVIIVVVFSTYILILIDSLPGLLLNSWEYFQFVYQPCSGFVSMLILQGHCICLSIVHLVTQLFGVNLGGGGFLCILFVVFVLQSQS